MAGIEADWTMLLSFVAALFAAGAAAGVLAGLLGVGGGIVIVPVLYHLFGLLDVSDAVRMHVAVGTSLAVIIPTSIMSARSHHARGGVDIELLKVWGPFVAFGVVVGTAVSAAATAFVLTAVFAVIAFLVALNLTLRGDESAFADSLPGRLWQRLIAWVIGVISVMMGIGGGAMTVPVLTSCSYPIRRAVGTSSAIGLIIAVPGAIGAMLFGLGVPDRPPGSVGYVNLIGFALIIPTTMAFAPLGARLAHSIPPRLLRFVFAAFLLFTSVRMAIDLVS